MNVLSVSVRSIFITLGIFQLFPFALTINEIPFSTRAIRCRESHHLSIPVKKLLAPGYSLRKGLIESFQLLSIAGGVCLMLPLNAFAAGGTITAPTIIREQIAESAAKIPGFGQPDVFYPSSWAGEWKVIQTYSDITERESSLAIVGALKSALTTIATATKNNDGDSSPAGLTISFSRNYVDYNGRVVLDRSFTETNRYKSIYSKYGVEKFRSTGTTDNRDSPPSSSTRTTEASANGRGTSVLGGSALARWEPSNPNILTVSTSDNLVTEVKVTKRAVEDKLPPGTFGYSEYSRVAEADGSGLQYAVPKIFGMRILTRFKEIHSSTTDAGAVDTISGIERLYIYKADTLDLKDEPIAILKSKFVMKRI